MYQFNHSHLFRKTLLDNNKMVSRVSTKMNHFLFHNKPRYLKRVFINIQNIYGLVSFYIAFETKLGHLLFYLKLTIEVFNFISFSHATGRISNVLHVRYISDFSV